VRLSAVLVPLQECVLHHVKPRTTEPPSAVWARWSRSSSRTTRIQYSSHALSVRRASTRASRESY
jgi:hypothetical protein